MYLASIPKHKQHPPIDLLGSEQVKKKEEEAGMVFKRSLSLPGSNPNPSTRSKEKEIAYHVRSTSLPCRSHPHLSRLMEEVRSVRSWRMSQPSSSPTPSWLMAGLSRLELLHVALDELLQLPQVQESLRRRRSSSWSETLLDDFLHLVDAYDCFRHALVSLQQLQSAAQAAMRRRDETKFGYQARSLKKAEKELTRLVALLRDMGKITEPVVSDAGEAMELAIILREVKMVMASASAFVFSGLVKISSSSFSSGSSSSSSSSSTSSSSSSSSSWALLKRRLTSSSGSCKRTEEEWESTSEGLKSLEKCIVGLEGGSDKVFRCLINTRVALLNILTS